MKIIRFKKIGFGICVLATITGALLVTSEIVALLILRRDAHVKSTRVDEHLSLSVYKEQRWAETHWREFRAGAKFEYHPYVMWRRASYRGETISIDGEGLRRTHYSDCKSHNYTIFMFGGSTMWGTGSPDSATIPSWLADRYVKERRPVCVRNYGETGWVSTQGLLKLLLELKHYDRRPNLVVFYDGANDVGTQYDSGKADVHSNFYEIKQRLESRAAEREASFRYVFQTNSFRLLQNFLEWRWPRNIDRQQGSTRVADHDQMAQAIVGNYLRNLDLVETLAAAYGFEYGFFWQPLIFAEHKPLTEEEGQIRRKESNTYPGLEVLYRTTYALMRAETRRNLFYIADIFDGHRGSLYFDPYHLGPEGNRIVATRIYDILQRSSHQVQKNWASP